MAAATDARSYQGSLMSKLIKRIVKGLARNFHKVACGSISLSGAYLTTIGAIVRHMPDSYGHHYLANVQHLPWPEIHFRPRRVSVTETTEVDLIPHVGEFDFAALFLKRISYEQEVFDFLQGRLAGYDAIVEIGSNVGVFTTFFSHVTRREKIPAPIFAFEPSREAYLRLVQNLAVNDASNVQAFNCALSDTVGFVNFFEPEGHLTNGSLYNDFAGSFSPTVKCNKVIALTGDQLQVLLAPYGRILFKIDVEGAEANVLDSLRALISEKEPDIVLEVLPISEEDLNQLDFIKNGYVIFNITKGGLIEKQRFEANTVFRDYFLSSSRP